MTVTAPPKRFYKEVGVAPVEGGYAIRLDGREVRTPGKAALVLPRAGLAEAVAAEWRAQGERIEPATMPLTCLACTASDQVASGRDAVVAELLAYAECDLLCYRAEHPEPLVARQAAAWQPLLDWAARDLDAPLRVTCDVRHQQQPDHALAALRRAVEAFDDLSLAALDCATRAAGSLVVALALHRGRLDPEAAFETAELDATYQIELWGEDPEATRRRAAVMADLAAARRLLDLMSD